jgi:hypothetical protein
MDDVVHRLARELAAAIGAGVSEDPKVEACREKARAAGYEMRISLEAIIGFASRDSSESMASVSAPARTESERQVDITANDRRFLRSLRIATDELNQEVE